MPFKSKIKKFLLYLQGKEDVCDLKGHHLANFFMYIKNYRKYEHIIPYEEIYQHDKIKIVETLDIVCKNCKKSIIYSQEEKERFYDECREDEKLKYMDRVVAKKFRLEIGKIYTTKEVINRIKHRFDFYEKRDDILN